MIHAKEPEKRLSMIYEHTEKAKQKDRSEDYVPNSRSRLPQGEEEEPTRWLTRGISALVKMLYFFSLRKSCK
jgi:hypothetical protein